MVEALILKGPVIKGEYGQLAQLENAVSADSRSSESWPLATKHTRYIKKCPQ